MILRGRKSIKNSFAKLFCGTMRAHLQEINSHKPIFCKIETILLNKGEIRSR